MTPTEAIEEMDSYLGLTGAQKLAKLAKLIPQIDLPVETVRRTQHCICGAELTIWHGRHSGGTIVYHPRSMVKCPRELFAAHGATQEAAIKAYVDTAPDTSCFDTIHDPEPEVPADDDFSDEFS
jgi:hypothetical protein